MKRPALARLWRIARLIKHLLLGLWITHRHFPSLTPQARTQEIKQWSQKLLSICDLRLLCDGTITAQAVVANHISWLDIFAIDAVRPVSFIAKQELSTWPLVGQLLKNVGTQFIDRQKRSDIARINGLLLNAIANHNTLAFFPEGTTSDGRVLKPFKSSLFQPLIEAQASCQILSIRYTTKEGLTADALAFVGELSFLGSLWQALGEVGTTVEITLLRQVDCEAYDRKSLSTLAEGLIAAQLPSVVSGHLPHAPIV